MPTARDRNLTIRAGMPEEDADYRALVDALSQEGLPRRAEAARAVEAVLCALSQRIAHDDFGDLRDLLPDPFRARLAVCERHAVAPRARFGTAEDFYAVVAEDLDRSPDEVEPTVRAVFAAVRAQLAENESEDVAGRLPDELQVLWRRPS
jgi:uncharacterized protein (DUF2267 family)